MKEAYKQLDDREVYEKDPEDPYDLVNRMMKASETIRLRGDLSCGTLDYFFLVVKDPKSATLYLLPKIYKCLHDVPGRLFQTAIFTLRIYFHFWTTICNHLFRGLNVLLRTLTIF